MVLAPNRKFNLMVRNMVFIRRITASALLPTALAASLAFQTHNADAARCLYVSSYHRGYEWSDGVERGLRSVLTGRCEIRQFDMDTKRHRSEEFKVNAALKAVKIIEQWRPDVVITSDDNAAKYLIQRHYKNHELPFVFSGLNWTVDGYGFPYKNVTGIVEVAPIRTMLEQARSIVPGARRFYYVGIDTFTEKKNLQRFIDAAGRLGLEIKYALVGTAKEWVEEYKRGQAFDFVVVGNNAGAGDWIAGDVQKALLHSTKRLSVTNHGWMMPYTILGVTKVPEEQGEWAAKAAIAILNGTPPSDIPIATNTRRDLWVNQDLLDVSGVKLPRNLLARAKKLSE